MIKALSKKEFINYQIDWVVGIGLLIYFFLVAEHAKPFLRQFSLNDLSISHPFAIEERVSGIKCLVLAACVPLFTFLGVTLLENRGTSMSLQQIKKLHVSVLGLLLSITVTGVMTDILKNWIARPRPDFLARCGPKEGTPLNQLVGVDVCTAPLGLGVLTDGMRSTPSGHSSISFSSYTYVTLWLLGHFKACTRQSTAVKILACCVPLLLGSYIALSRTQDYRHHFADIFLGSMIGNFYAVVFYHKYFNYVWSSNCDKHYEEDVDYVLPVYNDQQ